LSRTGISPWPPSGSIPRACRSSSGLPRAWRAGPPSTSRGTTIPPSFFRYRTNCFKWCAVGGGRAGQSLSVA
jgi:hypothetical protein